MICSWNNIVHNPLENILLMSLKGVTSSQEGTCWWRYWKSEALISVLSLSFHLSQRYYSRFPSYSVFSLLYMPHQSLFFPRISGSRAAELSHPAQKYHLFVQNHGVMMNTRMRRTISILGNSSSGCHVSLSCLSFAFHSSQISEPN